MWRYIEYPDTHYDITMYLSSHACTYTQAHTHTGTGRGRGTHHYTTKWTVINEAKVTVFTNGCIILRNTEVKSQGEKKQLSL